MERLLKFIMVFAFGVTAFFSCKKVDLSKVALGEWNPNLAIPLAHSVFDVYDIFAYTDPSDLIVIDPNSGMMALVYTSDVASITGSQFVNINDFSQTRNLSLNTLGGTPAPNFSQTLSYNNSETIDFNFNDGAQVKEFKFDNGNFDVSINSTFQHPVMVNVNIPSLKKNGTPFYQSITIPAGSSSSMNEALAGYIADFTLNNTTFNKLKIDYNIVVNGNGNAVSSSDQVSLNFNFSTIEMDYAKGFFGTRALNIYEDSVLLKIYQGVEEGYFELVDPRVTFFVNNSFGMPVTLNLNQIKSININSGQVLNLLGYTQTHVLNTPTIIGDSALTAIFFDKNNTNNLQQVVTPAPKYVTFDATALTNPNGNTGIDNFVSKHSKIHIKSEVELPLHGLAHSFKVRDTVDFSSPSESENLKSVMFRIITDNGFPINVLTKLRFLNENYQEVFVVDKTGANDLIVESAQVNAQGKSSANTKKITDIVLNQAQMNVLDNVKYIEIYGEANTKDFQSGKTIKIYDTYKLGLKLSVQFEAKVKL